MARLRTLPLAAALLVLPATALAEPALPATAAAEASLPETAAAERALSSSAAGVEDAPRTPEASSSVRSNDDALNRIFFGLGLPHVQIREELLRPFRWDGVGGLLALGYERRTPSIRHAVGLELPAAWVTNRYGAGAAAISLRLDYTLLVPAGELWGGRTFVGGRYRWDLANQYYMDWDEEHLYWLNAHELGPAVSWEREIARSHLLQASISLPIVALAARPPVARTNKIDDLKSVSFHLGRPHEDMEFTSLHEYVSTETRLAWAWAFSERWFLVTAWELRYRSHASPRAVTMLDNSLVTALAHDF